MARAGITPPRDLRFPAGSIYWIKPALLNRLARLELKAADFEPEQALLDGTTAHAVERLLGVMAQDLGFDIIEARALLAPTKKPL
jgi:lipopolysaccharide biosynthesis protein